MTAKIGSIGSVARTLCVGASFAVTGAALGVDSYTATPVPPLTGGFGTVAYGVNNAGMVVGQADNELGELVAFAFSGGVTTALPNLAGGSQGQAQGVNTAGVVVGTCRNASNVSRAVRWDRDQQGVWTVTDLGTLAVGDVGLGVASRINDAGLIVGYSTVSVPGSYHACIWDGAAKIDLGTLGYTGNLAYSQGLGINEAGDACGYAYRVLGGPEHGLYYTQGAGIDVTPEGQFGLAQWHAVTASGALAGYVSSPALTQGAFRPAIREGRDIVVIPLIDGLPDGYGYDMNDEGVFVGAMFLAQPVPDPNIFKAFVYEGGVTTELNTITTGAPGNLSEARDISASGLIAATAETPLGPQAVLLTPVVVCQADYNEDDSVSVQDIFDFLAGYFANDPAADFNDDGSNTVQDIFDFLEAYFTGCS